MKKIIGIVSVILAVLSLLPSIVPGAVSVMGLFISMGALVISIFSISRGDRYYFIITLFIVFFGVFFINDALRIWNSLPIPINAKLAMYAFFAFVVLGSIFFARKLSKN